MDSGSSREMIQVVVQAHQEEKKLGKSEQTFTLNSTADATEIGGIALLVNDFIQEAATEHGITFKQEFPFTTIEEILKDACDRKFNATLKKDEVKLKIVIKEKDGKITINFRDNGNPFQFKDGASRKNGDFFNYDVIQPAETKVANTMGSRDKKEGKKAYEEVEREGGTFDFKNRGREGKGKVAVTGGTVRVLFNKRQPSEESSDDRSSKWCVRPKLK